ncbi:MAG: GAF domain-containing protein [Myxococcales bacterium]|nr:GAF domain-containing protein [Myxococcales bacterium]
MSIQSTTRRVAFETARLALARVRIDTAEDFQGAALRATKICAEALGVERVGIWLFHEDGALECVTLYARAAKGPIAAAALLPRSFPIYCDALEQCRAIVADDAVHHPLTAELADPYLRPNGISSMLDAPVFRNGRVFGVLCHEHVGDVRTWTRAEIEFASAVAEVVALVFEQTERARAEAELRENLTRTREFERLQEVRRLSSAVAHDFNNVLGAALGQVTLVSEGDADSRDADLADLREILEVGRRLAASLLRFSNPRAEADGRCQTLALAGLRATVPVLGLLMRPNARLAAEITGDEVPVGLTALELEQLVLNLCVNGRDAVAQGGTVGLVAHGNAELSLVIHDDGVGMPDEVKQHLFEPYYTTKTTGTGMGLVVVLELVRKAGGTIRVDSALGRGTRVRVTLPRV